MEAPTPLEELLQTIDNKRNITIGLPAPIGSDDRRFPLTPEGAALLTEHGFTIKIESSAAGLIHYDDEAWTQAGAKVTTRTEAFGCDIVIHLPAVNAADAMLLKRGALLLTFLHRNSQRADALAILLQRHIIAIAIDLITDEHGHKPFADILRQIDGCAAMTIASALLADAVHGKGILLGGITGIVPCEVMIIGSDSAAQAAARAAIGMGAVVRMFDNDYYSLRDATERLQHNVIGSAIHPKVFYAALHSADIVIATSSADYAVIGPEEVELMKRGVIVFDLSDSPGENFPTLGKIDLALAAATDCAADSPTRHCYINAGNAVPRTAAMALSNTFINMLNDIVVCDGFTNALKLNSGLRYAAYTFLGKPVGAVTADRLGLRRIDINLFLQFS